MKRLKLFAMGAGLLLMTAGVFAFRGNKSFAPTELYLGATATEIATPITGFWSETNATGYYLASIVYNGNTVSLTYDEVHQVYFKP